MKRLSQEAQLDRLDSTYTFGFDGYVVFLRRQKNCTKWWFEGTEYSFDQNTKQKTTLKLNLALRDDHLRYEVGGRAWKLHRMR